MYSEYAPGLQIDVDIINIDCIENINIYYISMLIAHQFKRRFSFSFGEEEQPHGMSHIH